MIKSFRHKGLESLYNEDSAKGVNSQHKTKLKDILTALDSAIVVDDMRLPGFNLHPLRGDRKGVWSVMVRSNWRVTFEFANEDAYVLDYEDYH